MFEVQLVPVGPVDGALLEFIAGCIEDALPASSSVRDARVRPDPAFDPLRGQYSSTEILARLLELGPRPDQKILGITDVDLFIPIFTFVFGEAQLGGRAALVSVRRLRQEFYGLAPEKALLYARAEKEVLHELGHTLGLVHCRSFECVMRFSNSIEEVDLKSSAFCESCAALARKALERRE